jgi:uncharacterized protein YjbJ (UPF0337 family)
MNNSEFEIKWKLARDQAKTWWSKLNDSDLDRVNSNFEQLAAMLQVKYGYSRERIEKEFNDRMAKLEATQTGSSAPQPPQEILDSSWKEKQPLAEDDSSRK